MTKDIEWLKKEIWYSDRNIGLDWKEFVLNLIDQLDEPEVLSQEWVDGNKEPFHRFEAGRTDYYVPEEDLQNLLVPKQELPVIPKFVADWIEHNKKTGSIHQATNLNSIHTEIHFKEIYANQSIELQELIARAWLDGYTVEESIYVLKVNGKYINRFEIKDGCNHDSIEVTYSSRPHAARVDEKTKVEIEKYLNVEVEEMEECP